MKIDLKITFDDLSDACKAEINRLRSLGYDVQLTYPEITKKNEDFWTCTYPMNSGTQLLRTEVPKPNKIDVYCSNTSLSA